VFARQFFSQYVEGHDVADYSQLLEPAGFTLRRRAPGRAWMGDLLSDSRGGARVTALVLPTWPAYAAGIEEDDELRSIDGQRINAAADLQAVLERHKPGDAVDVVFAGRSGVKTTTSVVLSEDPHVQVVPAEAAGLTLTTAQRAFRAAWLGH